MDALFCKLELSVQFPCKNGATLISANVDNQFSLKYVDSYEQFTSIHTSCTLAYVYKQMNGWLKYKAFIKIIDLG